jgi:hypothetical protein
VVGERAHAFAAAGGEDHGGSGFSNVQNGKLIAVAGSILVG